MTRRRLVWGLGLLATIAFAVGAYLLLRPSGRDEEFGTVDEYQLDTWFGIDLWSVGLTVEPIPFALAILIIACATISGIRQTLRRRRAAA